MEATKSTTVVNLVIVQREDAPVKRNETPKKVSLFFTAVQLSGNSIRSGSPLTFKDIDENGRYGSAQEKAKSNYVYSLQEEQPAKALLLSINSEPLVHDWQTRSYTGAKFSLESYTLGEDLNFTQTAKISQPLSFIPSSLFTLDKTSGFIGSASTIQQVDLSGDKKELSPKELHSFEVLSKKVVDTFCYSAISSLLVAVDDTIWPKFAFLFKKSDVSTFTFLSTFTLPERINEQYQQATLGGETGNTLILTTSYFHRGGSGQRLVFMDIDGSTVTPIGFLNEFLPRINDAKEAVNNSDVLYLPESMKGDKSVCFRFIESTYDGKIDISAAVAWWKGLGAVKNNVFVGSGKRGVIVIDLTLVEQFKTNLANKNDKTNWQEKGLVKGIDLGNCIDLKVVGELVYVLAEVDGKYKIVVVDGNSLKVVEEHLVDGLSGSAVLGFVYSSL